jgi:hypothetical protein
MRSARAKPAAADRRAKEHHEQEKSQMLKSQMGAYSGKKPGLTKPRAGSHPMPVKGATSRAARGGATAAASARSDPLARTAPGRAAAPKDPLARTAPARAAGTKKTASNCIQVSVRIRPLNRKEINSGNNKSVWTPDDEGKVIQGGGESFPFANVFGENSQTSDIYDRTCRELVAGAFDGYNGTIFCYGQTSSGKTHTMIGYGGDPGITVLAIHQVGETRGRSLLSHTNRTAPTAPTAPTAHRPPGVRPDRGPRRQRLPRCRLIHGDLQREGERLRTRR